METPAPTATTAPADRDAVAEHVQLSHHLYAIRYAGGLVALGACPGVVHLGIHVVTPADLRTLATLFAAAADAAEGR